MILPDAQMDQRPVKPLRQVPVIYTDIDGTIRHGKDELGHFVNTVEDVKVFDGVPELLWRYKDLGWRIIGISNQAGVGLGHMTMDACFAQMGATQMQCRSAFDKIVFCAHRPYDDCPCRKPKAGMVFDCQNWLDLQHREEGESHPLSLGIFVGDRPEDEMCAVNAGLKFVPAAEWRRGKHFDEVLIERNRKHGLG